MKVRRGTSVAVAIAMLTLVCPLAVSEECAAEDFVTIGWYETKVITEASGGEAGTDWCYGIWGAQRSYYGVWAYANAEAAMTGGVKVYAGVYAELRFKSGCFGYYTATMDGTYGGQVAYPKLIPGMLDTELKWSFRIIDLNNVRPNYIVKEGQIDLVSRNYLGSETVPTDDGPGPFSSTITWYVPADCGGLRYGLEAYVEARAESLGDIGSTVHANAYLFDNKYWGIWFDQITVQAPCPSLGCVLEGTEIMLADGSTSPVESLKKGAKIMGYNLDSGEMVSERVNMIERATVSDVLVINNGLLTLTTTNQPIYARTPTYTGWVVDPIDLQVGWEVFNPVDESWIAVTDLEVRQGEFTVYDVGATSPDNYIANGILLDRKPIKV